MDLDVQVDVLDVLMNVRDVQHLVLLVVPVVLRVLGHVV